MRIWILHVGEELPVDPNPRPFRYGQLAHELSRRGHDVLRWAPTFQHFRKVQRFEEDRFCQVESRYAVQFVYAPGYARNVSLARLQCYRQLAHRFRELAPAHPQPDLVLTGIPSLQWCTAALDYSQPRGIPLVLDVRDCWPDIYWQAAPAALRPAVRWMLGGQRAQARRVSREAAGIVAVSETYLEWGLRHADRSQGVCDRVFPLGYQAALPRESVDESLLAFLRGQGVDVTKKICMFAGLLERSYDVQTMVRAAQLVERKAPGEYQLVICGDGSKGEALRREAAQVPNLLALGWVTPEVIGALMGQAAIGLAAYTQAALQTLPNKVFEYLAGGLPIVTSLRGEFEELLRSRGLGACYRGEDPTSLAAAICELGSDPELLHATSRRCRAVFEEKYRADKIYSEYADYLETLRAAATKPPHLLAS